jgi:hypothetical protein
MMSEQAETQRDEMPAAAFAGSPRPRTSEEAPPMDARIEDYLDHVSAPLVGLVPYARRRELRAELRVHLEALVATHEELGSVRDAAVVLALRQFGPPRHLSRQWAREWTHGTTPASVQPAWRAMAVALGSFGLASLLTFAALAAVSVAGGAFLGSGFMPLLMILVGGVMPLLAGMTTGLLAPARHALGTFLALAILALPSLALALPWQPGDGGALADCGMMLALAQLLSWVPIGCGAAALGGTLQARLSQRPRNWVLQ